MRIVIRLDARLAFGDQQQLPAGHDGKCEAHDGAQDECKERQESRHVWLVPLRSVMSKGGGGRGRERQCALALGTSLTLPLRLPPLSLSLRRGDSGVTHRRRKRKTSLQQRIARAHHDAHSKGKPEHEEDEVSLVAQSDAGIQPGTMMVLHVQQAHEGEERGWVRWIAAPRLNEACLAAPLVSQMLRSWAAPLLFHAPA